MALRIEGKYAFKGRGFKGLRIKTVSNRGTLTGELVGPAGVFPLRGTWVPATKQIELVQATNTTNIVNAVIYTGTANTNPSATGGVAGFTGTWTVTRLSFNAALKLTGVRTERGKWSAVDHSP